MLTALAVLTAALWQPMRPLYARLRKDWMLLSFALYGITLRAAHMEDYPSTKCPFEIVAHLILAAGAWVYLRRARPSSDEESEIAPPRRVLPLLIAMTLAILVVTTGAGIICASTDWPPEYRHTTLTWQSEVFFADVYWVGVAAIVLIPALLTLLPRPDGPSAPKVTASLGAIFPSPHVG